MSDPQATPPASEGMSAGDKRALLGCGAMLFVLVGGFIALIVFFRMSAGGQGDECEAHSDCKPGFRCSENVFRAEQSVCRQLCDSNADCPSGNCGDTLDGQGLCQ